MGRVLAGGGVVLMLVVAMAAAGEDEIPTPFARFEPMVGAWKGTARPAENKVKGWPEKHAWAWKFVKGTPVRNDPAARRGRQGSSPRAS